jgi:hypothetical protein
MRAIASQVHRLVMLPQLQDLTVVLMAQKDLAAGRFESAMSRLAVDNDKIRTTSPQLAKLVQEWFENTLKPNVKDEAPK